MTNERIGTIRRVLGIVTAAAVVITGLCLMAACARIYFTGDRIFTREIAGAALHDLRYLLWTCGALILAGLCCALAFPEAARKPKAAKQTAMILKRLQKAADLTSCDPAHLAEIQALRAKRRRDRILCGVLTVLGGLVFLCYALQGGSFHQSEITPSMIRAMGVLLPCMLIPAVAAFLVQRREKAGMEAEIALLKQLGTGKAAAPAPAVQRPPIATKVIFILAVVLLVWGYVSGGTVDVLTKAINICTECVGLG